MRYRIDRNAEQRRDPRNHVSCQAVRPYNRQAQNRPVCFCSVRLVQHHENQIARSLQSEKRRRTTSPACAPGNHARPSFFGRSGLAADIIAWNIRLLAGAVGHDIAQQARASSALVFGRNHLLAAAHPPGCLRKVGVIRRPPLTTEAGRRGESQRAHRDAVAEADRGGFDRAPIGRDRADARVPAIRCAPARADPILVRKARWRSAPERKAIWAVPILEDWASMSRTVSVAGICSASWIVNLPIL